MATIARQSNPLKPSAIPTADSGRGVHDWVCQAITEGDALLQSQDGYGQIPDIIKAINGTTYEDKLRASTISQLSINDMGKIALDMASSLTDIKPFFEYKTSNERFEAQAAMGQKLASHWWTSRLIDLKFCDCIKYALAAGSGYAHQVYNPDIQDLDLIPEDPRDVLPIRPSDNISIQHAFGVIIRRERTVNYLRHMYPQFANRIQADRDGSPAAMQRQANQQTIAQTMGLVSGFMSNLYASLGGKPMASPLMVPVSDLYTIYVKDDSVNMTGRAQVMGQANWSYIVQPGEPLYPRGRCIVTTASVKEPLYDGPNMYWHGMFPVSKLTLDPWPWLWLGKSPMKDLLGLQRETDRTARGISDRMEKMWRPDLVTDAKFTSKALADRIDTRRAGLRLHMKPGPQGQGVKFEYPPVNDLQAAFEWLKMLDEKKKDLAGTQELSSLVQLGQIPSSETIERMVESWSPAIRLRSRCMEAFLREFAMMTLMNFFQFYTTPMRVAILGPKGQTFEDFDFDPGTLIPDMLSMGFMDDMGNPLPRYERAREFIRFFAYQIAPGSLLAASEVTDKLMYLQLTRMGIMDPATLMQKLGVNNLGLPPDLPDGILPRLQWFQQQGIGLAPGPASGGGAGGGPGRPASAQAMPRMTIKES